MSTAKNSELTKRGFKSWQHFEETIDRVDASGRACVEKLRSTIMVQEELLKRAIWNTIPASSFEDEYEVRRDNSDLDSSVLRLTSVALEKEIKIRGCTSERRHYGIYVAALGDEIPREQQKIIFCGDHTAFTNKSPHPIFSLKPHDKRYYKLPPEVPEVVPRVEITQEEEDVSLSDMSGGSI